MLDPLQHQGLKLSFRFPCQYEFYADGKTGKNCIPNLIACLPKIEKLIGLVELSTSDHVETVLVTTIGPFNLLHLNQFQLSS
jgi:hypothetical protein